MTADRPFARTGELVPAIWHERADGTIAAGVWTGLVIESADLERRAGDRVRQRAAAHGRPFDFFLTRGLRASDLKIGWPMHALLRFRGDKLGRHIVIDTDDALEAEWIAANAGVQGVAITYTPTDMAACYRVFTAALNSGVALIGSAVTADAAALQLATPAITAALLAEGVIAPPPLSTDAVESLWSAYMEAHGEPPKPRGGHPPDEA